MWGARQLGGRFAFWGIYGQVKLFCPRRRDVRCVVRCQVREVYVLQNSRGTASRSRRRNGDDSAATVCKAENHRGKILRWQMAVAGGIWMTGKEYLSQIKSIKVEIKSLRYTTHWQTSPITWAKHPVLRRGTYIEWRNWWSARLTLKPR